MDWGEGRNCTFSPGFANLSLSFHGQSVSQHTHHSATQSLSVPGSLLARSAVVLTGGPSCFQECIEPALGRRQVAGVHHPRQELECLEGVRASGS